MNTKITIEYSNGDTHEFTVSDELEALINDGEMFSISTMHSDMGSPNYVWVCNITTGSVWKISENEIIKQSLKL